MNKIARLIITLECHRRCRDCCNNLLDVHYNPTLINSLELLRDYDVVCITGGEPMLDLSRTIRIILELSLKPNRVIYLYTAKYVTGMMDILNYVDGIHFTLHHPLSWDDLYEFYEFQRKIDVSWELNKNSRTNSKGKSFRLYIDPAIDKQIAILPKLWKRVEVKPWEITPCLPEGEDLFVLDEQYAKYDWR